MDFNLFWKRYNTRMGISGKPLHKLSFDDFAFRVIEFTFSEAKAFININITADIDSLRESIETVADKALEARKAFQGYAGAAGHHKGTDIGYLSLEDLLSLKQERQRNDAFMNWYNNARKLEAGNPRTMVLAKSYGKNSMKGKRKTIGLTKPKNRNQEIMKRVLCYKATEHKPQFMFRNPY